MTMSLLRKLSIKPLGFFLVISLFAGFLTTLYVSNEHIFYWWDYAFYKEIATDTSRMFVQTPLQALRNVYFSTWLDYNYYFALPIIPFMELFKYSRLGYIIGLVFVYYIPTLIVSGHIARKVFPSFLYAGWIAIFTGTFIPVLWASVFRGYPDIGAVLFIAIAIVIYLQDMELKKWKFQLPMIGFLSGLAIIFRRHFAYNAVSLLFSIGVVLLYFALQRSKENWKELPSGLWNVVIKIQIILAFLVLSIVLLAPGLLLKMVYVNYLNLYSSYSLNSFQVFIYFLKAYGVLWVLAIFGLTLSLSKTQKILQIENKTVDRKSLYFILLFGATSLVVWVLIPRQVGAQYILHIALPVILSVSALIVCVFEKTKTHFRRLVISSIFLILGYNLWAGLAPAHLVPSSTTQNYPPLYRSDYDEVERLISYLRETTDGKGNIYVADSSNLMNDEIVHYAEVARYGESASSLQILYSPQIDSRDFYPLNPLLQADYIVITTPFQHHLSEDEQKVVQFIFDVFAQKWKISEDFKKLPEEFHLYDGAVLSVYKRQIPTSFETTLITFKQMRNYIGRVPGRQSDWMLISPSTESNTIQDISAAKYSITMSNNSSYLSFLYTGADLVKYQINGNLEFSGNNCSPILVSMNVYSLSESVSLLYEKEIITNAGEFILNIEKPGNTVLVLSFQRNATVFRPLCNPILEWELSK
jgi:hypothetical protein